MNRTFSNISAANFKPYFLVVASILLVLLTSCPVKLSIKNWAGIPIETESGVNRGNQNISTSLPEKCPQYNSEDNQIVQKHTIGFNDLLPAFILTLAFLFHFGFRVNAKEIKHPLYSGSNRIRSAIPLFLEYRKLIIH